MPPPELVTAPELRRALIGTIETLAPRGSARSVPCNVFADTLVAILADTLAATGTADETERLVELFRDKLEAALAQRDAAVGHA